MTNPVERLRSTDADREDFGPYAPSEPIGGMATEVEPWERHTTKFSHISSWSRALVGAQEFVRIAGGEIERTEPGPRDGYGPYMVTVHWRRRKPDASPSDPESALALANRAADVLDSLTVKPRLTAEARMDVTLSRSAKTAGVISFGAFAGAGLIVGWGPVGVLAFALVGAAVVVGLSR